MLNYRISVLSHRHYCLPVIHITGRYTAVSTKNSEKSLGKRILSGFLKTIALLIETVLVLAGVALGIVYFIYNGPSVSMKNLVVHTLNETSAAGFVNRIYLSQEEIDAIVNPAVTDEYVETDTSLITIQTKPEVTPAPDTGKTEQAASNADAWGLVDEDNDGIILCNIKGEGYSGFMIVVKDPSRVIMGSVPSSFGRRGYTVAEMCEYYDAVAGINAGGFYDPNGQGNGSIPDSLVVFNGETYYSGNGTRNGFVGIDSSYILHVASRITLEDIAATDMQYGVCFGPVLLINGEPTDNLESGVNPRTAIGQRSDGAMLLLVIDGRSALSIGATFRDLQDIMLQYGAVNACNLDGGSSSMMWYEGDYINNCASVIGIRPVPTTFLVLKEGATIDG